MFKKSIKLSSFVLIICLLNLLFFHFPFLTFTLDNLDYTSASGLFFMFTLTILVITANFFVFYLLFFLSPLAGRILTSLFFIVNSIAVYFVNTYSAIIDESMIGNVINTNLEESSAFFSFKLIIYLVFFGILPSIWICKTKIKRESTKFFFKCSGINLLLIVILVVANASQVLWIDKHSKVLGGLAMPWSYMVNIPRFYIHKHQENVKEILLPDAKITNKEKSVVVLVIGESGRSQNFSLYGYEKNTNPLLSKTDNVYHFNATSCATYTTATVKCILEHENTGKLYEILPNYLDRNGVEVIWRTTNWGEPPVHIANYLKAEDLKPNCEGVGCDYDEILLSGLKEQILKSDKDKILVILHSSTSHGPTYSTKYPPQFEVFKPVCHSVELAQCSQEELINAYDNTIVYTDYLLHQVIEDLKQLKGFHSSMIYVSDHGESLGEKNLYMHGVPMSIAPKEQYQIPFIVWVSDPAKQLKPNEALTQNHVFHSIMNFLSIQSPIYNEDLNIYKY
ncbi:phosphoethanolamine--lipid A transferase EptA [Sphingobacterium paucimobilis]|uniref:Sulfatase N-terminal domain-containing protein n=1 Tax=Sphingobacterium paucimobilis HER1398 TaxID=1346330 RepID=U2HZE5_9SPHI|nr:phosphoethanolamine--lipid A transferase EptA [Sphingobacterium paucimobilis]ERJ60932.1 hypothetical protein M472_19435 [Sphingobacterium paucimobilis HER1398]